MGEAVAKSCSSLENHPFFSVSCRLTFYWDDNSITMIVDGLAAK